MLSCFIFYYDCFQNYLYNCLLFSSFISNEMRYILPADDDKLLFFLKLRKIWRRDYGNGDVEDDKNSLQSRRCLQKGREKLSFNTKTTVIQTQISSCRIK